MVHHTFWPHAIIGSASSRSEFIFQQDIDPKHTAKYVKKYLNPIENLRHKLKVLIKQRKVSKEADLPDIMKLGNNFK
jgi:hypothetical protein